MSEAEPKSLGTLSRPVMVVLILLAGGLMFAQLTGVSVYWMAGLFTVVTEGAMAAAIFVAAGGYGYLAVRRLAPADSPTPLRVMTGCVLGLWMLSTALLGVGSAAGGLLKWWIWWPVVGGGLVLAIWQARRTLEGWTLPERFDGRTLIWVLVAVAVGLWLAGATRPPGQMRTADKYDVLEYHLQLPREYYLDGRIATLDHNVYSFYPLGTEMLFLLGMVLRNGPYEGMYLAKLVHGLYGVLAVAAIYTTLKRDDDAGARFSAGLLCTAPFAIYLSWLAMVELAQIACLAVAVLWLREWIRRLDARSALAAGLMLGAACAAKYLSVALVAAPVLAVMTVAGVRNVRRLGHVVIAAVAATVLLAPWLIRNTAATGNPVFPLATTVFGRGHFSAELQQRWIDGHAPDMLSAGNRRPVPTPPGYEAPKPVGKLVSLYYELLRNQLFGQIPLLLAGVGICVVLAQTRSPDWFAAAMAGVLVIQVALWATLTWMPGRFLTPALVPICLLGGGLLARLSRVQVNPLRRGAAVAAAPDRGPWGLAVAAAAFLAAAGINLFTAYSAFGEYTGGLAGGNGTPGEQLTSSRHLSQFYQDGERPIVFPDRPRFLLLGQAQPFYYPPGSTYATVFDRNPLTAMIREGLDGKQILQRLRDRGITHVWVDWAEIWRLAGSYGFDAELSEELLERFAANQPPDLAVLRELIAAGARPLDLQPNEEMIEQQVKLAPEADRDELRRRYTEGLRMQLLFGARLPWKPDLKPRLWPRFSVYVLSPAAPATAPATRPATSTPSP